MSFAIRTFDLSRVLGKRPVVADLALAVPQGAIYGFLGRNGAGKTTTIRLLLGLLAPDRGRIELFGRSLTRANRTDLLRQVGALIETPPHYDHLTASENLRVTCRLRRLPASEAARTLDLVGLGEAADRRVGGFSLGMRQRLGLARALLGNPRLLVLDEPTNGLDPTGIIGMRALLRRLVEDAGVTVFLSSHLLGEVEQIADHIGLIEAGRLVTQGRLGDLLDDCQGGVELVAEPLPAVHALLANASLRAETADAGRLLVRPGPAMPDAGAIARLLVEGGCRVTHLAHRRASLEDLYRLHARAPGGQTETAVLC